MRILWGALRAVSVEMMGVLAVLAILHGATGLAVDTPWRESATVETEELVASQPAPVETTPVASVLAAGGTQLNPARTPQDEPQRATARQWFQTLFPAAAAHVPSPPPVEQRAEYAQERLDHYSRLYGIAARD